ncbi:MAG: hypothetical protein AAGC49_14935, partial [Brevundimonas sp.]|nr:hypothetical protein [Pseudomonadota bacterium]
RVTAATVGIDCAFGLTCSTDVGVDDSVTLTAVPDADSTFTGWSATCPHQAGAQCFVDDMSVARTVVATFTAKPTYRLTIGSSGDGHGTIDLAGVPCASTCSRDFQVGAYVWITATKGANTFFDGWNNGDCVTSQGPDQMSCRIYMDRDRVTSAMFRLDTIGLQATIASTVTGIATGSGTITSPGLTCTTATLCQGLFERNVPVRLTAVPSSDSTFASWSGVTCTNSAQEVAATGTCEFVPDGSRVPSASFTHKPVKLTAGAGGTGTGTVRFSAPAAFTCPDTCSAYLAYGPGTVVTLTPQPDAGMKFDSWTDCPTVSGTTCRVTMAMADRGPVTAQFSPVLVNLTLKAQMASGTGGGAITSPSTLTACAFGTSCVTPVPQGTLVTLTAVPDANSVFVDWSGSCHGSVPTCTVTLATALNVTANFRGAPRAVTVTKEGTGSGRVNGTLIDCGPTCAATVPHGTRVTMTPTAAPGSHFAGWSGACTGTGSCAVTVAGDTSLVATFTLDPVALTVATPDAGTGTVTGSVDGTDCDQDCSGSYPPGTVVTLTATPDPATSTF